MNSIFVHPRGGITSLFNQTRTPQKIKLRAKFTGEYRCKIPQQNISKLNAIIYKKNETPFFQGFILDLFQGHKEDSIFTNQSE